MTHNVAKIGFCILLLLFSNQICVRVRHFGGTFHLRWGNTCFLCSYILSLPEILAKCNFTPVFHDYSSRELSDVFNSWHLPQGLQMCLLVSDQCADTFSSPFPKGIPILPSWPSQPSLHEASERPTSRNCFLHLLVVLSLMHSPVLFPFVFHRILCHILICMLIWLFIVIVTHWDETSGGKASDRTGSCFCLLIKYLF